MERAAWTQAFAAILSAVASIVLLVVVVLQTMSIREQTELSREQVKELRSQYERAQSRERRAWIEVRYKEFESASLLKARATACKDFRGASPHVLEVFNFFEIVGGDLKNGMVEIDDVRQFFQTSALLYWYAWRDWSETMREHEGGDKTLFGDYEELVKQLHERGGVKRPSVPELQDQCMQEAGKYSLK